MTRGRVGDKTYTGKMGVATDHLRALDKLAKTPEGTFGRTSAPFAEQVRACIASGRCPWCDRGPYKVLATHTLRAHAVSGLELRELADLVKTASICSPDHAARQAARQAGQRLPDVAYERARVAPRILSEAGKAINRAKLDAARSPEQARMAGERSAAATAARNEQKYREISRLFGEGKLYQEIADTVGLHARTVAAVLRREGLVRADGRAVRYRNGAHPSSVAPAVEARRAGRDRMAAERVARFVALGATREALLRLAAEWKVSTKSATDYLRSHGAVVPDGRSHG